MAMRVISRGSPTRLRLAEWATIIGLALFMPGFSGASAAGLPGQPKLLPPEQAFRLSARALDPSTIEARFDIADG